MNAHRNAYLATLCAIVGVSVMASPMPHAVGQDASRQDPIASVDDAEAAARRRILESDRWRRMEGSWGEWLSVQKIYSADEVEKMNAAGVRIVLGTDGNTPYAAHVEMADMVAAGMSPMQVITAATGNGAQFLKMSDAGTIDANKSADFIVLDANPLDDITNTRKISAVYLRGAVVDRSSYR